MTSALHTYFIKSLWWTAAESLIYHGALTAHQAVLFAVTPRPLYGTIGALFSIMYLLITLTNLGFDHSITSYWQPTSRNQYSFKCLVYYQLIPNYICLLAGSIFIYTFFYPYMPLALQQLTLYSCLVFIVLGESIKKTAKTLLSLLFYNKLVTCIELLFIGVYILIVWLVYFNMQHTTTLYGVFVPMAVMSCISGSLMAYLVFSFYLTLPKNAHHPDLALTFQQLCLTRVYTYATSLSYLICSGNALVTLVALQGNLEYAATLKLLNTVAHSISAIFYKIFGYSTGALFANSKHMQLAEKRRFFTLATYYIHQTLYSIIIISAINYTKLITMHATGTLAAPPLFLALLALLSENLFIAHEKFLITEGKAHYITLLHGISVALLYGMIGCASSLSIEAALWGLIVIRLGTYALLNYLCFYWWKMEAGWQINPWYASISATIGLLLLIVW